jgi:hypothetical protein
MRRSTPSSKGLPRDVQTALLAKARLLEEFGWQLGRPHVDTLKHANRKELRFDAAGRLASGLCLRHDPAGVILVAGDKSGGSEKRFCRSLIATADKRLDEHPAQQKKGA